MLNALPIVVAVLLARHRPGPAARAGARPFLSAVLTNGALFPLAALAIVLPLFLPIAVAVVAGDSIAGEAQAGTLRYLLARPAGRTRLLVAKLVSVLAFVLVTVLIVAAVGYLLGHDAVRRPAARPAPSRVGDRAHRAGQLSGRTLLAIGYVAVSMLGVAAFALFFSTFTDSPLGATLGALAVLVGVIAAVHPGRRRRRSRPTCRPGTGWRSSTSSATRSCGATSSAASALQGVYVGVLLAGRLGELHDQGRHELIRAAVQVMTRVGRIAPDRPHYGPRPVQGPHDSPEPAGKTQIGRVRGVPTAELSGDGRDVRSVLDRVEEMQDQAQGGKVIPDVPHLVEVRRVLEHQSGEDVGDLVRQNGRRMQFLAGCWPALQACSGRFLTPGGDDDSDNDAGVDNNAHRSGSSPTRVGHQFNRVGRCVLLRPTHEPIERRAGALAAPNCAPAESSVHEHAGRVPGRTGTPRPASPTQRDRPRRGEW